MMTMTMNITLPDALQDWIRRRVESGEYVNADDYVRDLIRSDRSEAEADDWLIAEVIPHYRAFQADRSTGKNASETLQEVLGR